MNSQVESGVPIKDRKKMKTSIVVSTFPSVSQTFVALQIAWLDQRGYPLKIVRMGRAGDKKWLIDAVRPVFDKLEIVALPYNDNVNIFKRIFYFLPVCAANTWRNPVASLRVFLDKAMRLKPAEFVRIHNDAYLFDRAGDADILHFQFATLANRYSQMKKYGFVRREVKIACSVRGYDISRKGVLGDVDWSRLFEDVSLFLPVCDFFRQVLEVKGFRKMIRVVGSPVDTNDLLRRKKESKQGAGIKILSVGRLIEKKGFDDAIEALSIVKQSYDDFQYTIVGDGPLRADLSRRILECGLSGQVDLKGAMPSGKTLELMAASDILIAPSKTGSDGEVEGIPNVLKEAMCLGLQVIATQHAGIPELIKHGENGHLVSENAPDQIAAAIYALIQNRQDWAGRARRAVMSVSEQFDAEKTTRDLIAAYEAILDEKETGRKGTI